MDTGGAMDVGYDACGCGAVDLMGSDAEPLQVRVRD